MFKSFIILILSLPFIANAQLQADKSVHDFGNITYLRTVGDPIQTGDIYTSMGTGIRVRNENLIFGTIELKSFYFPRTNLQVSPWNLSLLTNIRYKYNSSIISKPDFVQIN
jgi:hypothetical protein